MAQNFIGCDRDQSFLMPPDVRDWLPEGHLAWFVLDAVAGMDLHGFYAAYRADGVGRRAYDPAMLVALLLYCYARGVRSARAIERACEEDVACKTIAMLECPDHATIARFVARHEAALAGLFGQVLGLCAEAGLVRPGVVAIDGTRIAGNASPEVNCEFEQVAREVIAQTMVTDLRQREPDALRGVDDREPQKHLLAVPALPAGTLGLGEQPACLVETDPRRVHPGQRGHLTNRHRQRNFAHSRGSLDFNPTSRASLPA
jgi:transposase